MITEKKIKKEDLDINEKIDMYLKEYKTELEFIFNNKKYCKIITDGTNIIELMIKLILTRENYSLNEQTSIIQQAIKTDFIPRKTKNNLLKILRTNNETTSENVTYKNTYNFLKNIVMFFQWFENNADELYYKSMIKCIKSIEKLPASEPSEKDQKYETEFINNINRSVTILEKHVEIISEENYIGAVTESYNVCSLMIELLLKKESYIIENGLVIKDNEKIPIIAFCTQNNIFSKECNEFLNIMEEYKNNYFKLKNPYNLAVSFLKGSSYFMLWFNNFYSDKYSIEKPFKINNCFLKIEKLQYSYDDKENFKPKTSKTKKQKSEIDINNNPLQINYSNNMNSIDFEKLLIIFADDIKTHLSKEFNEKTETIISKLDEIKQEIKNISLKITDYQSLIQKQIKNFDTDEEKDKIISAFADVCAERIIEETNSFKEDDSYNLEKTNLITLFGENTWNKLSEESKTYLISSKLMFNNLNDMKNIVDYSGVCILLTKTLEVELYKRFFENFFNYLENRRYKKYDHYPTGLLYKKRWPLNEEKFNLGTVAYILCLKQDNSIDYYHEKNNKEKLIEYCSSDLFNENDPSKIESLIIKFGKEIEEIRKDYRNPSAHRNEITQKKARECLNLVLYEDKLLIKMLDSFKK
ncbi:hypothetical protein [Methanobrevibacter millerae]|nr:hypothetical protein [Methanobrevibacter millerae]